MTRGKRMSDVEFPKYKKFPKYKNIEVKLVGEDGNAFNILGKVSLAMARGGCSLEERENFYAEATEDDYDNLLAVCMKWVTVI